MVSETIAIVLTVVSAAFGTAVCVEAFLVRRLVLALLALTAFVLLILSLVIVNGALYGIYFVYAMLLWATVLVLYPLFNVDGTSRERRRMFGLILGIFILAVVGGPMLALHNIPYLVLSIAYVLATLLPYSIGCAIVGGYGKKHRTRLLGFAQLPWGAAAPGHWLIYLVFGLLLIGSTVMCNAAYNPGISHCGAYIAGCAASLAVLNSVRRASRRRS